MVARILLPITLACLLWGAPLRADPSALTTIEAAEAAASAVDRWCTGMSAERTTEAATALREVGAVWVRVSRSHDLSDDPLLLYWRGRLSACLNQDERAISDLQGFLDVAGDDNAVASLAREARRMLLRLGVSTPHPAPPGIVAPLAATGVAACLGAAGLAINLGTWTQGRVQATTDGGWATPLDRGSYESLQAANRAGLALSVGGAVGAAAGGVISAVVAARSKGSAGSPTAWAAPLPRGGMAFFVGGRF